MRQLTNNTDPGHGKQPRDWTVKTTNGPLTYMLDGSCKDSNGTPAGAGWYALLGGPAYCYVPGFDCAGGIDGYYQNLIGPASVDAAGQSL